jgi:site-specific DNA-methyltransferase (adenine-specific)
MSTYPSQYFDLAIVDPPYGIGEDGRNNHTRGKLAKSKDYRNGSRYDNMQPDDNYFGELFRISKNQIIWGANHFGKMAPTSCWIVWDKDNNENDFADCELAWTSFNTAVRKYKYRWNGMLQENMRDKETRIHPNHKPVSIYRWLLKNYAKEGDKILDTHLGSQSSRIAAYDMGFDFTGYELDKDYFEAGCKRFNQHKAQLQIFV